MDNACPIKHSETLLGFTSRYARERGMRMPKFMRLTGIKIWHHASFEAAVVRLAAMTGNSVEDLASHAVRTTDKMRQMLCGELIDRRDIFRAAARYCPHCVLEDYAGAVDRPFAKIYCRAAWMHRRVGACLKHEVELVSISEEYQNYSYEDFTSAIMDNWEEVKAAAENAKPVSVHAFDRYFSDRLNGLPCCHDILDALPLFGAHRVCDILGIMVTGQKPKSALTSSPDELSYVGKIGFDILATGYDGLRDFLGKLDHRRVGSDDKAVGSRLYGKLYDYLHDNHEDSSFASIVNFVRDHAFSVHPLGPENNFLGHGGTRKFHSVRSAFTEHGIHPATLRKFLKAKGLLDDDSKSIRDLKISIEVGVMDSVIEKWKDSVPMSFATELLDTAPQVVRQIIKAGLLSETTGKTSHALKNLLSRKEVEGLVAQLENLATSDGDAPGMVRLRSCVPFLSFVDQLRGVLDGKIPLGISKAPGEATTLEHLRVDLETVKSLAGVGIPRGFVPASYINTRVVANKKTITGLADLGVFEVVDCQTGNGLTVPAYSAKSVRAFMDDHISFRKLAREKANWAKTEKRMAAITPAYDFGGVERIYRRADLIAKMPLS